MSVLSNMARVAKNSDKNINTEQYLSQIHASMLKQIQKRKVSTEDSQALKLQTFLRQIKYLQKNGQFENGKIVFSADFPFSPLWSKMSQMALMNALYTSHKELFEYKLLTKTSSESYNLGAYLEQGITQVLNTFESAISGKDYYDIKQKNETFRVGTQHTQVPDLVGLCDTIMKDQFNSLYLKIQQELKKYKKDNSDIGTFMPSVQGKIDIAGYNSSISVGGSFQMSPYASNILNALKGATFTAKNYISTKELKFGQTNPFRIFATVAPEGESTIGRFNRMLNCFEEHSGTHSNAPMIFYRIRAIYELTGVGMQYVDTAFNELFLGSGAKFLVWNNPIGDIYVIPTQKIIDELIENATESLLPTNWKDALYGPITLPQLNIADLAL